MGFGPTDAQRDLRDDVREYARTEIVPLAAEIDRNEEYPAEILDVTDAVLDD
ncbi:MULTISPECIES: acyl-CoA dehydrogenase family protein [Halococcus]|uniref:Butyryl-CoA dehydrogenase n=1 Tax=Halococcus salifodinae DSM 8989 TaxID=1227456 RepID=M0MV14_9EURY|nr:MULTISPECIES: acyl-CoA dehydrogenase family protein [Halococcus]EMA49168.1 Butyryl-CoA dehydrogenase [Halococcus salifodinae DSM 8989]